MRCYRLFSSLVLAIIMAAAAVLTVNARAGGTQQIPAECQPDADRASALETELNQLVAQRDSLPVGSPLLADLDRRITQKSTDLAAARKQLDECLNNHGVTTSLPPVSGAVCRSLRNQLNKIDLRTKDLQKELNGKGPYNMHEPPRVEPRPKDVVVKEIKASQAVANTRRTALKLLGC